MIIKRRFKELTSKNVENFALCQKLDQICPTSNPLPLSLDKLPTKNTLLKYLNG